MGSDICSGCSSQCTFAQEEMKDSSGWIHEPIETEISHNKYNWKSVIKHAANLRL